MSKTAFFDSDIQRNTITLELAHKELVVALGTTSADSLQTSLEENFLTGGWVARARIDVLRDKIHEDRTTVHFYWETPASWWQQFKVEIMPVWFTERYPIKYKRHSAKRTAIFKRYAEYPKANVAIPKNQPLFIETLGGSEVIRDEVEQL